MKLELHAAASAELAKQAAWYERQRAGLGDDLLDDVGRALSTIAEHPARWPLSTLPRARRAGARHFVLRRFPLTIEYVIFDETVFVVAVAHMSRAPGYWLSRARRK